MSKVTMLGDGCKVVECDITFEAFVVEDGDGFAIELRLTGFADHQAACLANEWLARTIEERAKRDGGWITDKDNLS